MPIVSPVAGRQFDVCGRESSPSSTSGWLASIARNCGAKPWSEATNVVGSLPTSSRARFRTSSASSYASRMNALARRDASVGDPVQVDVVVGRVRAPPGSFGETSPRNWCWNSSVVGMPTSSRSGLYVVATYSSIGRWAVFQ